MKKVNYIEVENLKVELEILNENPTGNETEIRWFENGEYSYSTPGFIVEENGKKSLYHSKEEYYYDNKAPMVGF